MAQEWLGERDGGRESGLMLWTEERGAAGRTNNDVGVSMWLEIKDSLVKVRLVVKPSDTISTV